MKALNGKSTLTKICVFFILACSISWPFLWWRDMHSQSWRDWELPMIVKNWTYMWGPGISGIICYLLFKKKIERRISFFGSSVQKSILFYALPMIALLLVGVRGFEGFKLSFLFAFLGFFSILGEEIGWRGFLQDSLRQMTPFKKYIIIGLLWEVWHFTTRTTSGTTLGILFKILVFSIVTILLAFLLGKAVEKTQSIIVPATLHMWITFQFEFGSTTTLIIFCISLPFWIYMIFTWNKSNFWKKRN